MLSPFALELSLFFYLRAVVGILARYVILFLEQDWLAFSKGQACYTMATLAE